MELNIKALEKDYVAVGGEIEGKMYTAPTFDNAKIRHLQSKITSVLLDYKHDMNKSVIRAQIPSYRKHKLELRNAKVKELEELIQAELDKIPEYNESQALHKMLVALREAKNLGIIIDETFDKARLEEIFTGLGGKIHKKTGKKRTRLTIYELPEVTSDHITELNDVVSKETNSYLASGRTLMGKIPAVKKQREARSLAKIEKAERAIENEKMHNPRYALAHATLDVIHAYEAVEKVYTKEMAD